MNVRIVLVLVAACCCLLLSSRLSAQTAVNLEKRYGTPVKEYEVRPGVVMTATYSDRGEVCKMVVEKRHFSERAFDLRLNLEPEMIHELIDELLPTEVRGGKTMGGFSRITGSLSDEVYDYQNVSIRVLRGLSNELTRPGNSRSPECNGGSALIIKWKSRACSNQ